MTQTNQLRRRSLSRRKTTGVLKNRVGYSMLLPGILCLLLVQAIPFFYGVYISFTDMNFFKGNQGSFVGIKNFLDIFANQWTASDFYSVFGYTLIFSIAVIVFSYIIGMYFAILLNRDIKFKNFFRALAFLPWFVNPMVISVCWSQLMDPSEEGILNWLFLHLHLIEEPLLWRGDPTLAKISAVILGVWKGYPMMMVMLLSAMQGIDKSIYEPATIAGASEVQKFRYITLPLLRPMSVTVMALQFIWMFGSTSYDIIMPFTAGGPARSTYVLTIEVFNQAFSRGKMGYAAAISLTMLVFLGTLAGIFMLIRGVRRIMESNSAANQPVREET